jgi:hypothetical protein
VGLQAGGCRTRGVQALGPHLQRADTGPCNLLALRCTAGKRQCAHERGTAPEPTNPRCFARRVWSQRRSCSRAAGPRVGWQKGVQDLGPMGTKTGTSTQTHTRVRKTVTVSLRWRTHGSTERDRQRAGPWSSAPGPAPRRPSPRTTALHPPRQTRTSAHTYARAKEGNATPSTLPGVPSSSPRQLCALPTYTFVQSKQAKPRAVPPTHGQTRGSARTHPPPAA